MIYRRGLTALILATLANHTSAPVGDADVPDEAYGPSGTPGEPGYKFTPYSIVTPMSAGEGYGPISDTDSIFSFPYSVSSFGTTREQTEWIADMARNSFSSLRRQSFDGADGTYTIMKCRLTMIGGIQKSGQTAPHVFGQTDTVTVFLSKNV